MTTEDQDAQVGRLVRERRDLRAHHQALVAKIQGSGRLLGSVARVLTQLHAPGQSTNGLVLALDENGTVRVSEEYHPQQIISGQLPTASDIREWLDEDRALNRRLSELDAQLRAFGA